MAHSITDLCDGCSACGRQCPTAAIDGIYKQRFHIDPELCIDCGVCGLICERGAVLDARGAGVARVPRRLRARPRVNPEFCNGCKLCVDFCPSDCLAVVGPRYRSLVWLAQPLACVSCGDCATVCIKGAIVMRPLDLRRPDPKPPLPELEMSP